MAETMAGSLDQLKAAIGKGNVVPFVGAGVSMAVKTLTQDRRFDTLFPSWSELLSRAVGRIESVHGKAMARVARGYLDQGRLEDAASEACQKLGGDWYGFLSEQFNPPKPDTMTGLELAEAVWNLGSPLVMTTNYDNVLRWACPGSERWIVENRYGQGEYLYKKMLTYPTVWHLHGHISEPQKIILTREDYAALYGTDAAGDSRYEAALDAFRHIITERVLLFIGFSGDDQAVAHQLDRVWNRYLGATGSHFLLVRENDEALKAHVRQWGIRLVTFPDVGEPLVRRLRELAEARGEASPISMVNPPRAAPSPRPKSNLLGGRDEVRCMFRQPQLAVLVQAFDDPQRRGAVLWGVHGVGKTQLALRLASGLVYGGDDGALNALAGRFDYVVWVTFNATAFEESVRGGYRQIADTLERPELGNTHDEQQLSTELLALMAEPRKRTLLMVDGLDCLKEVHTAANGGHAQFRKFLDGVPPQSFVLLTSPVEPVAWLGYVSVRVTAFRRDEALEYLGELRNRYSLGENREEDEALWNVAGGLPKALSAGMRLLALRTPIEDAVTQLRAHDGEFSQLVQQQMKHLNRLSLVVAAAADRFTGSADAEWVRLSTGLDPRTFASGVSGAMLREEKHDGRSYLVDGSWMSGVVGDYLRAGEDPLGAHAHEMAVQGTFRFYRAHAGWEHTPEHRRALAAQLDNLRQMVGCALQLRNVDPSPVDMREVCELVAGVAYFFHVEGSWKEAESLLNQVLRHLDEAQRPSDRPLGIRIRILLGRHFAHLEEIDRALETLTDALRRAEEIEDRTLQAEAIMRRGHALHRRDPDEALRLLNQALEMSQGHPERIDVSVAAAGYLAAIHNGKGEFGAALEALDRAMQECGGEIPPRVEAHYDRLRGDACLGQGKTADGRRFYLASAERSGDWSDRRLHAWNLLGLAQCDNDPARARESLGIFEKLNLRLEAARADDILRRLAGPFATADAAS